MRSFSQALGRVVPLVLLIASCGDVPGRRTTVQFEVPVDQGGFWYKGNTHAHTTMSDGDSPPEYVARWYKEHGYNFLVLSDHNVFTDPQTLSGIVDSTFLLIPGEELTSSFDQAAVHVNGLNIPYTLEARTSTTLVGTIQANVDVVREVEGVPHINHPNFRWSFGAKELAQIERDRLLEISNGHPTVHNEGGEGSPGMEEIWDILLSNGKRIYGIAVDDAHHFQGEFALDRANPGRGWVTVKARNLDAMMLMEALEAGHFYASTGVELSDIVITHDRLEVHINRESDFRYTTTFIGEGGGILSESTQNPAIFELVTNVRYVRARIRDSAGRVAWTQPVFVAER